VTLDWHDEEAKAAFGELITKSFWIDDQGFIRLSGLEVSKPPRPDQKHQLYNSLLNSFLQFGRHRSKGGKYSLSYDVDNRPCWIKDFEPITWFVHQDAPDAFFDKTGRFSSEVEVIGWQYPGCGQRHANVKSSDPPDRALLLLYAPVGVVYYAINSRVKGRKVRLAMLIPEVRNLELYAAVRQAFAAQGIRELTASSACDAALRMLLAIEANTASNQFAEFFGEHFVCRVMTFGIVAWSDKQKTRTSIRSIVSGQLEGFDNYRKAAAIFKNHWQIVRPKRDREGNQTEPETYFVATRSAREFIADNIAQGQVWYHDLSDYISRKEAREQLQYERKELNKMVATASYDDPSEQLFIRVCQESWHRRMGKLGARARREQLGDAGFWRLVNKEAEKLRISFSHSKNAETLRETIVDFWSRAGQSELLRGNGLTTLLPLFSDKNWKKSRDLALLALISYQPQDETEKAALSAATTDEGDDNE
jgi:CRISPR-associated protein Cas8a1/Csx13